MTELIPFDDDDGLRRAFAAYFRTNGSYADIPSSNSGVAIHDGKRYVVLRNRGGTLAVYRVLNNGRLKGLKRWPAEVEVW